MVNQYYISFKLIRILMHYKKRLLNMRFMNTSTNLYVLHCTSNSDCIRHGLIKSINNKTRKVVQTEGILRIYVWAIINSIAFFLIITIISKCNYECNHIFGRQLILKKYIHCCIPVLKHLHNLYKLYILIC